jgi:hypothetical protein
VRVFAKRFFGFNPTSHPFVAFGNEETRDALINASSPGDLIVFVGTQGEPTVLHERGRLLGVAEFTQVAADTRDLIAPASLRPIDLKPDGSLALPKCLPILRAWVFQKPRFMLLDVLKEQLTFEATNRAVQLDENDARVVMAIPRVEVPVWPSEVLGRLRSLHDALPNGRPTTGPVPISWQGVVSRDGSVEAWTYVFRFGRRNLWKIGHTQDVPTRLAEVNQHVPFEEVGERWAVFIQHWWSNSQEAYGMEQRMFRALSHRRTEGERVRCTEDELQAAWMRCL